MLPTFETQPEKLLLDMTNPDRSDILKSLEIRFCWLISQTYCPESVGFETDSPEYIIFRFTNLTKIALLINENEKYFCRGTNLKGNGCISLVNVCECLYEESKTLYSRHIEQLKELESYEEVCLVVFLLFKI